MQRVARDRWQEVRDFFPQSTELPRRRPPQGWTAFSLGHFTPKKYPPAFIHRRMCQHPRWITGTPGRWVCPRCGCVALLEPVPGKYPVLEEDLLRQKAAQALRDWVKKNSEKPPPPKPPRLVIPPAPKTEPIPKPTPKPQPQYRRPTGRPYTERHYVQRDYTTEIPHRPTRLPVCNFDEPTLPLSISYFPLLKEVNARGFEVRANSIPKFFLEHIGSKAIATLRSFNAYDAVNEALSIVQRCPSLSYQPPPLP